ncbi:MAG: hypothetical protein Q8S24_04230 [Eubacteriales bacterium]|nr:hypothetical protein [Eubacteriales bacterium]
MSKRYTVLSVAIIMILALSACAPDNSGSVQELENTLAAQQAKVEALELTIKEHESTIMTLTDLNEDNLAKISLLNATIEELQILSSNTLLQEALEVMTFFKNEDAAGLDSRVSPTRGVRFSPYQFVKETTDITFYPGNTVPAMFTNTTVYVWGEYDGSGDSIAGEFASYYPRFVYDQDFLNPEMIGINSFLSTGNMINNIEDVYPNDQFVEFYFSGFDPQYDGMDWRSLTLVFEDVNGTWYLVGVIHGEWTT